MLRHFSQNLENRQRVALFQKIHNRRGFRHVSMLECIKVDTPLLTIPRTYKLELNKDHYFIIKSRYSTYHARNIQWVPFHQIHVKSIVPTLKYMLMHVKFK
jgi:hypothetical protein